MPPDAAPNAYTVQIALITSAASLLGVIASIIIALINRQSSKKEIEIIRVDVNSKMAKALEAAKSLGYAEGKAEGNTAGRAEARSDDIAAVAAGVAATDAITSKGVPL